MYIHIVLVFMLKLFTVFSTVALLQRECDLQGKPCILHHSKIFTQARSKAN
jgi:hypothetical protein